ncbi:hypothetical protein SDC9_134105 [bioreactor metagenome]|uniref:Uncharacterized protein n=1 Tax=bioreactor metagenome TaxID=1076179 RepID=A0A645DEJ9_9ZZZZ
MIQVIQIEEFIKNERILARIDELLDYDTFSDPIPDDLIRSQISIGCGFFSSIYFCFPVIEK